MGSISGCAGNDKDNIIGIWRVNSSKVDGHEIGDGKGWFDFKKDGTVDTRPRPGKYDTGKYEIDPEKGTLTLTGENGSGMVYEYALSGDELTMNVVMQNQMTLAIQCERVDDYPITKENDLPDDVPPMRQPG